MTLIVELYFVKIDYSYSYTWLVLTKENNKGEFSIVESEFGQKREIWIKKQLKPGKYIIQVDANWESTEKELSLLAYGPHHLHFQEFTSIDPIQFLEDVWISKAAKEKSVKWTTYAQDPKIRKSFVHSKNGFGYIYFENLSRGYTATFTIRFVKRVGIMVSKIYE